MRPLIALLALVCLACSPGGSVQIQHDSDLKQRVRELSSSAGSAKLVELANDISWSTVHVFNEGASAERIESVVGKPVIEGRYYRDSGNLLVFVDNGNVTAVVSIVPDVLATEGKATFGREVRLEPRGTRTPAVLRLVE